MLSSKPHDSDATHPHHHHVGFVPARPPSGTIEYVTSPRDTLRSIAVAFDTTTTSLMKLNRMSSLTVFPGQTLYVPSQSDETPETPSPPPQCEEIGISPPKNESWDSEFTGEFSFLSPLSPSSSSMRAFKDLVMVSSKSDTTPDRNSNVEAAHHKEESSAERRKAFRENKQEGVGRNDVHRNLSRSDNERERIMSAESTESEPFEEGFLKMTVHYITENKEMVGGVMLVTPTALMFDPEADDPVVLRDGCADYGIMCHMHLINSVAMYNDTSRMTPSSQRSPAKTPSEEFPVETSELCTEHPQSPSSTATIREDAEENIKSEQPSNKLIEAPSENEEILNSDPLPLNDAHVLESSTSHKNNNYSKTRSMPGIAKPATATQNAPDYAVYEDPTEMVTDDSKEFSSFTLTEDPADKNANNDIKLETEFPFIHSIIRTVGDLLPLSEMQPKKDELKQPPRSSNSNHMFLCIRARRPMVKTFSTSEDDEPVSMLSGISPEHDERLPEYWFQVPRKKSDYVYAFFLRWTPENDEEAVRLGFVVMAEEPYPEEMNDTNQNEKRVRTRTNSSLEFVDDFFDESYSFEKEWEIISIHEAKRRSIALNAIELAEADDSLLPELEKPSNLLTESTLLSLCRNMPNRCIGYSWYPVYTTFDHGTSLRTLYRNMSNLEAPVVLIVQDTNDNIFGALCSTSLHVSDHYYGTGESFLFTLSPEFEVFKWTGENSFFIKGDTDALTFGGGKGTFGLWLDADLCQGSSHPCETFRNKVLSYDEDFLIQSLEVWVIKDM